MFDAKTYIHRRTQLKKKINDGVILFLGNKESSMNYVANTYRFRQDSNFLYFFGIDLPNFAAIIDIDSGDETIYGDDFGIDDIIWMGEQPSVKELAEKAGVKLFSTRKKFLDLVTKFVSQNREIHFLPPYRSQHKLFLSNLLGMKSGLLNANVSYDLVRTVIKLRSIKDEHEIAEIEKACDICCKMHVHAMKMAKPGIKEQEIAGAIEGIAISVGWMPSFPIILSQNGEILHNHSHHNLLQEGKLMLVDAGAETSMHYASDCTRTIPVSGKFSEKQKKIYNIVLGAYNHAISLIRPGITYFNVHIAVCKYIAEELKKLNLMKGNTEEAVEKGAHALFMPHGLGHMMGLDVHDMEGLGEDLVGYNIRIKRSTVFGTAYLRLGKKLQEGFVLTIEPGIYFIPVLIDKWKSEKKHQDFINYAEVEKYKNFGGIRLEDDFLVTNDSVRILGKKRIPITVEEIEETMRKSLD